jgi:DNA-binding protein HU-beta
MTKADLISAIAGKSGLTKKDAEKALNAFTASVTETLVKGESVQLIGFGTFEVRQTAERTGRNPQTGKAIKIAAKKSAKFKAGKALSDAVNG